MMSFALERMDDAFAFLSLEKNSAGYRVLHYEKCVAHGVFAIEQLQGLFSQQSDVSSLIVGVRDSELVLRHILVEKKSFSRLKMLQRVQAMFCDDLNLRDYSWDAYPLASFSGEGAYFFCVAYPLKNIRFLEELGSLCQFKIKALEPSVCALARMGFMLLKLSEVLFLLRDNDRFTLVLALQGDVFALRQFQRLEDLDENIRTLPFIPETIIHLHDEHLAFDLSPYLQSYRFSLKIGQALLAPIGLALRACVEER